MSLLKKNVPQNEKGFSLIELLVSAAILGILSGIGIAAFRIHSKNAQYARAEATLAHARTALEAGQDYLEGQEFVFSTSAADGSALADPLASSFPGLVLNKGIMLRLSSSDCGIESRRMDVVSVYACDAGYYTFWMRNCGGMEVIWPKTALPPGIC